MDVQEIGSRVERWWNGQAAGACEVCVCVCLCGPFEKAKQVSQPENRCSDPEAENKGVEWIAKGDPCSSFRIDLASNQLQQAVQQQQQPHHRGEHFS